MFRERSRNFIPNSGAVKGGGGCYIRPDKPTDGYRTERLSTDVHDFLVAKDLTDVVIDGHSMGCSVIWGYWELFGPERLKKIILTDQSPAILTNPAWSEQEKADAGSLLDANGLFPLLNTLSGPEGVKKTKSMVHSMLPNDYPKAEFDWIMTQNLEMPRIYAARLLLDHATKDWRYLIPEINLPTLVFGGKASVIPWRANKWVASQIKGARQYIFEKSEGGYHFAFMLNATKYNNLVESFIA